MAYRLLLSPVFDVLFGLTVKVSPLAGEPVSVSWMPLKSIGSPLV